MESVFKQWSELSITDKINVKQFAMDRHGKRWHTSRPNFCAKLNELQLYTIISTFKTN